MTRRKHSDIREIAKPVSRETVFRTFTVEGRRLITVRVVDGEYAKVLARTAAGSIVRIISDGSTTDKQIEAVRDWFLSAKAEKVTVVPRPKGVTIPPDVLVAKPRAESARKVVEELVKESNSGDRESLSKVAQSIMAEVGL